MSELNKNLKAGFTGQPEDAATNFSAAARNVASMAKSEANAVAATAQEHPAATGTALLLAGLLGVALGYALGSRTQEPVRHRYW